MACIHCFVSGQVQGVFFRSATRDVARRLGLTGWVRNLPDGRVEVMAAGSDSQLAALREWLRQGPPAAHVTGVACTPAPEQAFIGFSVRHSG
jgi:acylphosphatase